MTISKESYLIRTLTDLHPGGDDTSGSVSIIDKVIQRDYTTLFPGIYSSSLKGALREHCTNIAGIIPDTIAKIFGGDKKAGEDNFFKAIILTFPVRSNIRPYYLATSPSLIADVLSLINDTKCTININLKQEMEKIILKTPQQGKPLVFGERTLANNSIEIEMDTAVQQTENYITFMDTICSGNPFVLYNDRDMINILRHEVPIITRNHLENGISQNLWYEEFIPRETRLFTMIYKETDNNLGAQIDTALTSNVQIGANSSIGYGICKFTKI